MEDYILNLKQKKIDSYSLNKVFIVDKRTERNGNFASTMGDK